MCGRPLEFKFKFAKSDVGSNAVMCPASIFTAPWPLAQMGSANSIQTVARHMTAVEFCGFCCSSVRPMIIFCYVF
jgi:hypothetical protein